MSVVWFIVVGLIVGLLARAVVPGRDAMGILATIVLGIIGSFVGGLLVVFFTTKEYSGLEPAGWIGSIVGAIVALLIYRQMRARSA